MKTLVESLFDNKLIEKDLFDNPAFKQWINQPNTLWYIYYYWESGEDNWLDDFCNEDWRLYKPLVDELLDIITDSMGKTYTWYMINFDQYDYSDEVKDKFTDEEEFWDMLNDANSAIIYNRFETKDGISKSGFRGPLPKNSSVTTLLRQLEVDFVKPGVVNGGILLTNEDTIMVLAFPKRTPKNILKLFNLN